MLQYSSATIIYLLGTHLEPGIRSSIENKSRYLSVRMALIWIGINLN